MVHEPVRRCPVPAPGPDPDGSAPAIPARQAAIAGGTDVKRPRELTVGSNGMCPKKKSHIPPHRRRYRGPQAGSRLNGLKGPGKPAAAFYGAAGVQERLPYQTHGQGPTAARCGCQVDHPVATAPSSAVARGHPGAGRWIALSKRKNPASRSSRDLISRVGDAQTFVATIRK